MTISERFTRLRDMLLSITEEVDSLEIAVAGDIIFPPPPPIDPEPDPIPDPVPDPVPDPIPDPTPDPEPTPDPIDPNDPFDSIIIERVGNKFEAVLVNIDPSEVATVQFTLDGGQPHTEKVWRYEYSPKTIPSTSFKIMAALTYKDGRPQLIGEKFFETVGTPLPPETGGGGVVTPPPLPEASIALFDTFVANATGTYYDLNPDLLDEQILQAEDVAPLFNTGETHYGSPDNRARIVSCPPLGRKGFTVLMDGSSDTPPTYGKRFASQKTNGSNGTLYPSARATASYTELYFASGASGVFPKFTMRKHFKSSSFQSKQGPPAPGNNSKTSSPRTSYPGQAEGVRLSFYNKASQTNPDDKGDMMSAYFGQQTYWGTADKALIDSESDLGFVVGAAFYEAHPGILADGSSFNDYNYERMLYPCKPDSEGNPTPERFLMPTDKLIKSWVIWNANTLTENEEGFLEGNYDGTFYWWLQIDGVNGGEPWLAGIVTNRLWTTGQRLEIGQAGFGAYFNQNDAPNDVNGFFVLRDIIYYQAYTD